MRYRVTRLFDARGRVTALTLSFTHGARATFVHARPYRNRDGFQIGWELLVPGRMYPTWRGNLRAVFAAAPTLARVRFNQLAGE